MPTLDENKSAWNSTYDWSRRGEEWSAAWGGPDMEWYGTVLPRIHRFLPADTILEIGPGFGRWSHYLRAHCRRLVLVDLSERCVNACRERFKDSDGVEAHVNEGTSLECIEDDSVDFVFSFDSLVHAEQEVIDAYVEQLARKLKPSANGFLHHSNYGEYAGYARWTRRFPRLSRRLQDAGLLDRASIHWRAATGTAHATRASLERAGMQCLSQEIINWDCRRLIDSLTTFAARASRWKQPCRTLVNPHFMDEVARLRSLRSLVQESEPRT
jgi:ubiquinone/menaquinone biosynthesis C-methylase UbiE